MAKNKNQTQNPTPAPAAPAAPAPSDAPAADVAGESVEGKPLEQLSPPPPEGDQAPANEPADDEEHAEAALVEAEPTVRALVLSDSFLGKVGEKIDVPVSQAAALAAAGYIDTHPAALAYGA